MDLKKAFDSPFVLIGAVSFGLGAFVMTCDKGLKIVQRVVDPIEVRDTPKP